MKRTIQEIVTTAYSNGHTLHPWSRGSRGFHTSCKKCGAFIGITIRRKEIREGEKLKERCQGE